MPRGGRRLGAGRPKGSKEAQVLFREAALKAWKQRVAKNAMRLFNAQMALAQGCSFLFKIGPGGKHTIVKDIKTIQRYLDGEEREGMYITTQRPNNFAISDMLDRAFGKAIQPVDVAVPTVPLFSVNIMPSVAKQQQQEEE